MTVEERKLVRGYHVSCFPLDWARCLAHARRNTERSKVAHDDSGVAISREKRDPLGVAGEWCVWRVLPDLRWWQEVPEEEGGGTFATFDVGPYQVRTRSEEWHDLLIQQRSKDDDIFILVVLERIDIVEGEEVRRFRVCGWFRAGDAKIDKYAANPSKPGEKREPCWLVPQDDLHPIGSLPSREPRYL